LQNTSLNGISKDALITTFFTKKRLETGGQDVQYRERKSCPQRQNKKRIVSFLQTKAAPERKISAIAEEMTEVSRRKGKRYRFFEFYGAIHPNDEDEKLRKMTQGGAR